MKKFFQFEILGQCLIIALTFISIPLYLESLGFEQYGYYLTLIALSQLANFLNFDTDTVFLREAGKSQYVRNNLISGFLAVSCIKSGVTALTLQVILFIMHLIGTLNIYSYKELICFGLLISIATTSNILNNTFASINVSFGRLYFMPLVAHTAQLTQLAAPMVVIIFVPSILAMFVAQAVGAGILLIFFFSKTLTLMQHSTRETGFTFKLWLKKSTIVQLWNVVNQARSTVITIVISMVLGPVWVTKYSLIVKVQQTISLMIARLSYPIFPLLNSYSQINRKDGKAKTREIFIISTQIAMKFSFIIFFGVNLLNYNFLGMWTGFDDSNYDNYFVFIALFFLFPMSALITGHYLISRDLIAKILWFAILEISLYLIIPLFILRNEMTPSLLFLTNASICFIYIYYLFNVIQKDVAFLNLQFIYISITVVYLPAQFAYFLTSMVVSPSNLLGFILSLTCFLIIDVSISLLMHIANKHILKINVLYQVRFLFQLLNQYSQKSQQS